MGRRYLLLPDMFSFMFVIDYIYFMLNNDIIRQATTTVTKTGKEVLASITTKAKVVLTQLRFIAFAIAYSH